MRQRKTFRLNINVDIDKKFIALLPALNINLHSKEFEFEWLIFGVYLSWSKGIEDPWDTWKRHIESN